MVREVGKVMNVRKVGKVEIIKLARKIGRLEMVTILTFKTKLTHQVL